MLEKEKTFPLILLFYDAIDVLCNFQLCRLEKDKLFHLSYFSYVA